MGRVGQEPAILARQERGDTGTIHDPAGLLRPSGSILARPVNGLHSARFEDNVLDLGRPQQVRPLAHGPGKDLLVEHGAVDLIAGKTHVVARPSLAGVGYALGLVVVEPEAHALLDQVLVV